MDKNKVIVIRGILDYAKVIGPARKHTGRPEFDKGPYWSVDVTPDENSMKMLEKMDLDSKLKKVKKPDPKRVGTGKYLSLKILENKKDGGKNLPPRIKDAQGNDWDGGLLGNGTVADVKCRVVEFGPTTGIYLQAMRILDLVPYEVDDFQPLSEDDEYFAAPEAPGSGPQAEEPQQDEELDDDVPF